MSGRGNRPINGPAGAGAGPPSGVSIGESVDIQMRIDGEPKVLKGKILRAGECVSVLVESTGRKIWEEVAKLEKSDYWAPRLDELRKQKENNPLKPLTIGPLHFRKYINEVIRKFQLVLVEVEPGVAFWYLLHDCQTKSLLKPGIYCFAYRIPPQKTGGKWNLDDLAFHAKCTAMEDKVPGILTTIANWISYGMASTGIRKFEIVETLLRMPYVARPELIPYFKAQYAKDLQNLLAIAEPLGTEIHVFRGSQGFNGLHTNFTANTFLSTTPNAKTSAGFANFNYKKMKEFIIPADYPVVDLREFNKDETEILLIPPLTFHLNKRGSNTPQSEANLTIFRLNLANRNTKRESKNQSQ